MKKIDLNTINWPNLQKQHDNGMPLSKLNVSRGIINRAVKEGLFIKRKHKILSIEHKASISKALKKAHENGNHPGWSHINSDKKRMSRPEKTFNAILNEDEFFNQFTIKYGLSVGKYFLDFALIDRKIDIEIDGVQHLRSAQAIKHDLIRDEYLTSLGWRVYRISVKEFTDFSYMILNLKKFILSMENYRKYDTNTVLNEYKKSNKYGTRKDYSKAIKLKNDKLAEPIIKELLSSDIDFSKFGWVNQASKIIGISAPKVNQWMKRHMLDFYNSNCFQRAPKKE